MNITCTSGFFYSSTVQPQTPTSTETPNAQMAEDAGKFRQEIGNRYPSQDRVELSGWESSGTVHLETLSTERGKTWEPQETTRFTDAEVSETARQLSSIMDAHESNIELVTGIVTDIGASRGQLAEHLGSIGKLIDEALSAGEISRQEYEDLNKGLGAYSEAVMSKAERQAAIWEMMRQSGQKVEAMVARGASREEMDAYAQNFRDKHEEIISKLVEDYCSINRSLMSQMISRVRAGESLFTPGTEQVYGFHNVTGYFKNGYVPAKPVPYP